MYVTEDSDENLFQKQSTFTLPRNRNRDLDYQTGVLNNINLEKVETKSKSNLSSMEKIELSKLRNDKTMVIEYVNKGVGVVTLSTCHYQMVVMQNLLHQNT